MMDIMDIPMGIITHCLPMAKAARLRLRCH
jgi:hypothetical protein